MSDDAPLLSVAGIRKAYPGALALDDVSFEVRAGSIHCLVGENGAGKSTLLGILSGAVRRDAGRIALRGAPVSIASPADGLRHGIAVMYQEHKLVPGLTVAENIFLGHEPRRGRLVDARRMQADARGILERLGEDIDPALPVRRLPSAQRQIIEIAKALSHRITVLALDEPTAALTDRETARLFALVRALRDEGIGVIYVSHRLAEIFEIGDRITVLRDGRVAADLAARGTDMAEVIRSMVGRELTEQFPAAAHRHGEELLAVERLCAEGVDDVSFTLRRGEILGVAGLIGSGKGELARALFGDLPPRSGAMRLRGAPVRFASPHDAVRAGVSLLSEDRNALGLFLDMNVRENISISNMRPLRSGPLLSPARDRATAAAYIERLRIKTPGGETTVSHLSGGNKQKVIVARWLHTNADLLVFHEPTAGVDVGAKFELYSVIEHLACEGKGIILVSSDLPELLGMCDRIAVMNRGRLRGMLTRGEATQEKIMALAVE
jgi:ribose transport system ATP-binding protein